MSDTIDKLLADLAGKDDEIEEIVMEINDDKKEQKEKNKERKKKGKKTFIIKNTKLEREKEQLEKDKIKIRKRIADLEKQSGQKTNKVAGTKAKGTAKAVGTGGGNKDGVRCYIRYNNAGNPYRICDDGAKPTPKKPPSKITPAIDASEFADKYGGYANLSKEQTKTYHRIYMANQREEERKFEEGGDDFKALVRATKEKEKEIKNLKKLKEKQDKQTKKENKKKFRADLKKLAPAQRHPKNINKLKEKYNIKDDVATNIKETANKIAEAESNIETLSEEIVDGKKKVSKSLGVKSKGKTIVGFD
tara:strand:- start:2375 stop:3289 length:915 start_codon:yes stop_codon:yes gene_type:complete